MQMASASSFSYFDRLTEVFPKKSVVRIQECVETILDEYRYDDPETQLDRIIDLLTAETEEEDDLLDEACGSSATSNESELSMYFEQLLSIFPDACPSYVRKLCFDKSNTRVNFDVLVDEMIEVEYPKRDVDSSQVFEQLKEMLPNADPRYLQAQADTLSLQPEDELQRFMENTIEKSEYPTMEVYLKDKREMKDVNQYITDFNVKNFLSQFPDPEKHFSDPKTQPYSPDEEKSKEEELYILNFLYNHYKYQRCKDIEKIFKRFSKNLYKTCNKLDTFRKSFRTPRKAIAPEVTVTNLQLLQAIAYFQHRKEIKKILKEYDINYKRAKDEAKRNGLLQTCACCYDEELIPEECYFCKSGCIFCKECVKSGAEAAIGDGKLDFYCLADCGAEYSIPTLQMVLDSVVFSKMAQRKQIEEIKKANIDGLETCPFCDFATIPSPDDKIFRCLNEDCGKESCRQCRHVAHIPLRCNEIEYDEDVKMRTYIENKMTEALLRKCWKCNKVFIKESGCNKMTCSCGAKMCYVCGKSINDYSHFSEDEQRCPLWTKDLNKFHLNAVIVGASNAKAELGIDKNPNLLKRDPSEDLENYFELPAYLFKS